MSVKIWAGAMALGAVVSTGCAQEQEALIVLHTVPPTVEEDEDSGLVACSYDPNDDAVVGRGILDVSAGDPYRMAPILLNNLPTRSTGATNSNIDDSELQLIDTVDITLNLPAELSSAIGLPLAYSSRVASDSLTPGEPHAAILEAIPTEYAEALGSAMNPGDTAVAVASIGFHATRTGNSSGNVGILDARLYTFPITLCHGCMVIECTCNGDQCSAGTEQDYLRVCGRAQDAEVSPHLCQGGGPPPEDPSAGAMASSDSGTPPDGGASTSGF